MSFHIKIYQTLQIQCEIWYILVLKAYYCRNEDVSICHLGGVFVRAGETSKLNQSTNKHVQSRKSTQAMFTLGDWGGGG